MPIVSASPMPSAPASSERATASSTTAGSTGPVCGQPNDVASVTSTAASGAAARIDASAAKLSSTLRPALARLCASDTDNTNCRCSSPAASARSAPRSLSTSPHRRTPTAVLVAATSCSASARAGTRSGRTNDVSSRSSTPAATSASKIASFASVEIGASSCRPSRNVTSRTAMRGVTVGMRNVSFLFASCPQRNRPDRRSYAILLRTVSPHPRSRSGCSRHAGLIRPRSRRVAGAAPVRQARAAAIAPM